MKPPPVSFFLTPAARAGGWIALREIRMPDAGRPFTAKRTWHVRAGETFAEGSRLGELAFALPPPPAGIVSYFKNAGKYRFQEYQLVYAPEDGVLTWQAPDGEAVASGAPIAAYIPLADWQKYERLLAEHDRQFRGQTAEVKPAGTAAAPGSLSGKLDAMIGWANAISSRAIRSDKSEMIPLLVRQLEQTIRAACPVGAEEIAPIFHRYFSLIQSIDERFLMLDARYAAIWRDPALPEGDTRELIRSWLENKEAVIRQITGDQTAMTGSGGGQP